MISKFLVCAAALSTAAVLQPYRLFVVSGYSMAPTFDSGQWVVGQVRPDQVVRGDVIVFRLNGETMVKRASYLPGDRIEEFKFLDEWQVAITSKARAAMIRNRCPRREEIVPNGRLYVLGDNLSGSVDSRTYGTVPIADVLAVVPKHSSEEAPSFSVKESALSFVPL